MIASKIASKIALSSLMLASVNANAGRNKFARDASQFDKQPISSVDFAPKESGDAGVDMAGKRTHLRGFDGVDANDDVDGTAPATKTEHRLVGASTRVSRLPV